MVYFNGLRDISKDLKCAKNYQIMYKLKLFMPLHNFKAIWKKTGTWQWKKIIAVVVALYELHSNNRYIKFSYRYDFVISIYFVIFKI